MTNTTARGFAGAYVPSPNPDVREQVRAYETSNGAAGATLEGRPVVILTSLGAKSGLVRKNPVMRIVDGDRYVAVASAGGSPTHPSWYANLVAHPLVRIQDGAEVREFLAHEVTGSEKDYFWGIAERFWPHFPEYRESAQGRDIPIMVLDPAPQAPNHDVDDTMTRSSSTKTVVDAFYQAGVRGELTAFAPLLAADFSVTAPGYLPWGGTHRGSAFFIDVLHHLPETLDFTRFRYDSFTAEGSHAVALITIGVAGTTDSVQISEHWEVSDGLAQSIRVVYFEPQPLLAKLGLPHSLPTLGT